MKNKKIFIPIFISICWLNGCNSDPGLKADKHYEQALDFIKKKDFKGAIIELKNSLDINGQDAEARYQLGKAYREIGKVDSAEKEFIRVREINPAFPGVHLHLAKINLLKHDYKKAQQLAEESLKENPQGPEELKILGEIYLKKEEFGKADIYLKQALDLVPNDPEIHVIMGKLYLEQEDFERGEKELSQAVTLDEKNISARYIKAELFYRKKDFNRAMEIYREIININQEEAKARILLTEILVNLQNYSAAIEESEKIIGKNKKSGVGYYLKGVAFLKMNKTDEAIENLQLATRYNPEHIGAHYSLGLAHYQKKNYGQTITEFELIKKVKPDFEPINLPLAVLYLGGGLTDNAINEARKVIDHDAKNALAHNILGMAYLKKNENDKGLKEFETALEIDPNFIESYARIGGYHFKSGNMEEAAGNFEKVLKIDPKIINVRILLAINYLNLKKFEEARRVVGEGLKLEPQNALFYNLLGMIELNFKDKKSARNNFQRAISINEKFVAPHFNLIKIHLEENNFESAQKELEAIFLIEPQNVRARLLAGNINQKKGNTDEAIKHYEYIAKNNLDALSALTGIYLKKNERDRALNGVTDAVNDDPESIPKRKLLVNVLLALEDESNAIKELTKMKSSGSQSTVPYNMLGDIYRKGGNWEKATEELEKSLNINPKQVEILQGLTEIALKKGDEKKAEVYANKIIDLDKNNPLYYIPLSYVYRHQKNYDRAIDVLKQNIKRSSPKDINLHLSLALLYAEKEDFNSSLNIYKELEKKSPKSWIIYFNQGMVYEQMNQTDKAIEKYKKALNYSSDNFYILNNLAYLMSKEAKDLDEALGYALKAEKIVPRQVGIIDTLSQIYYKKGDRENAMANIKKALQLSPQDPTVQYHYALNLLKNGEKDSAKNILKEIIKSEIKFPERKEVEDILRDINRL